MKKIIMITLLFSLGCSSTPKNPKPSISEPLLNVSEYDEVSDYFVNDRQHFKSFLDKYWDSIKLSDKKPKNYYVDNFQDRRVKDTFVQWMTKSINDFNSRELKIYHGKMFSYFYQNRGKDKTIFYSHGNVSPLAYWAEFATAFNDRFKDYNVVFIHSTKINYDPKNYSAEELNSLFEEDTKNFFKQTKISADKSYFNIVCHSALFTYQYFKNNPNGYAKIVYYAPMIKKASDDVVQDFSKIFDPNLVMDNFYSVYYLYSLSTPRGTRSFPIPHNSLSFNIATEKNLTELYYKGLDISAFKNKALIHADGESMLTEESMAMKEFNPSSVILLKNMLHHDYFSVRDRFNYYFDSLEQLILQ